MKSKWFDYGKIKSVDLFNKLKGEERDFLEKFRSYYQVSASKLRSSEAIREVLRFKKITGCNLKNVILEDLHYYLKELRSSSFSDNSKNKVKSFIHRFLKWSNKDWSIRFNEFEDLKYNSYAENIKPLKEGDMFSKEDINKLIKNEKSLFWQTFLIVQYEAGLRTIECRELKWSNVEFEDDGFGILNIPSKKNKFGSIKTKPVLINRATNFLKELKKSQDELEIVTEFVFPSPRNPKKPISKSVNLWFGNLTEEVLGQRKTNYCLRHTKGTELQRKVREGKISKDDAVEFMRHSAKMFDKVYSHMSDASKRKLQKKTIYNTEELLTDKKKHELELKIERQDKTLKSIFEILGNLAGDEKNIVSPSGIKISSKELLENMKKSSK